MLDQLQLFDIARYGRLRHVEAGLAELLREPFLRIDLMRVDQLKDLLMSCVAHSSS